MALRIPHMRSPSINTLPDYSLLPRHSNRPSFIPFERRVFTCSLLKTRFFPIPPKLSPCRTHSLLSRRVPLTRSKNYRSFSVRAFKRSEAAEEEEEMTMSPAVKISGGRMTVKDRTVLEAVPGNIVSTAASASGPEAGVFVGMEFDEPRARQVAALGVLRGVRFVACFRFKLWWMAQKMGNSGRQMPLETQFLLVETRGGSHVEPVGVGDEADQTIYAVFLPLIEGPFRACLQGNAQDELELCLESGDKDTTSASFTHSLYISAGSDPYATITNAIGAVKSHLNAFKQRHEKRLPGIIDYFGWCTWDAFYQEVTQEGVEAGLASLTSGGTPPKFVIIDDGWQSVRIDSQPQDTITSGTKGHDQEADMTTVEQQPGKPILARLADIKENKKFQKEDDPSVGISNIVKTAKEKYGLRYVYVWHAIVGYWGGVHPGNEMEKYGSLLKFPQVSKGVAENEPGWKDDAMAVQGLGLMDPKKVYKFYNDLHGYLARNGVDGVKVDVQCILETLGGGLGGRVELTRQYHQALDASVARNFPDNGCIACMSHNTDALYCSKQTAIVRASDDFYPRDPVSHTIHMASVAYNNVFLGEFMQPDWDMFHSLHSAGEYHGSARGISGGPVYVSDAPGKHNFELLKKLVLPDGSILRARLPGRPTKDCLFNDPARDGISLLKIWNMNKYTGVLGVYNCQGAAWNSTKHKNTFHSTNPEAITGSIKGRDVHLIAEASTDPTHWDDDCAVYSHRACQLTVLPYNSALPISLKVLEFDVFTITPIRVLGPSLKFGPLGLIEMFNAGGAIEGLRYMVVNRVENGRPREGYVDNDVRNQAVVAKVCTEVKGCGKFGAYSSAKPRRCLVGSKEVGFDYDADSGLISMELHQMPEVGKRVHSIEFEL